METNEVKTTGTEKSTDLSNVLSQIKGFFQKSDSSGASKHKTKAFRLTRKDSLISVLISVLVLADEELDEIADN